MHATHHDQSSLSLEQMETITEKTQLAQGRDQPIIGMPVTEAVSTS